LIEKLDRQPLLEAVAFDRSGFAENAGNEVTPGHPSGGRRSEDRRPPRSTAFCSEGNAACLNMLAGGALKQKWKQSVLIVRVVLRRQQAIEKGCKRHRLRNGNTRPRHHLDDQA